MVVMSIQVRSSTKMPLHSNESKALQVKKELKVSTLKGYRFT